MKISAVQAFPIWVGNRNQLLVKVETDEGLFGWGESGMSYRERAVVGAVEHYREFLIGRDQMRIGALWQEMYRSQYFEGGRVLVGAMSAIDIALYDIKGKALGVPVYELLGGKHRDRIPTFATTFETGDKMIEEAQALVDRGWRCIRFFPVGQDSQDLFERRESVAATVPGLIRARGKLSGAVALGIDYHHRLSVAEATSFCQRLPSGTLDFLEEPIRDESPTAYEALRKLTNIPFAIGEEFSSKWQFLPYIERDIHQFNRIDVCNVGSLTESMKVAGWSEAHYVDLVPHNPLGPICTAATVHLAAAVSNFAWMETFNTPVGGLPGRHAEQFFPVQMKVNGSFYKIPDGSSLGIEVDEDEVRKHEFRFAEAPHLRRRDGSHTNW